MASAAEIGREALGGREQQILEGSDDREDRGDFDSSQLPLVNNHPSMDARRLTDPLLPGHRHEGSESERSRRSDEKNRTDVRHVCREQ